MAGQHRFMLPRRNVLPLFFLRHEASFLFAAEKISGTEMENCTVG